MTTIVQDLIQELDNAIHSVGENLFVNLADVITPLAGSVLTVYIIWLGYRVAMGGAALKADDVAQLLVRIFVIFSIGLYWQNFLYLYDLFSTTTGEIAWSFFTAAGDAQGNSPAQGMDQFANSNKIAVNNTVRAQGSITRGFLGAIMLILMAILQCIYVFIVAMSKIALGVCVAIAPLAFLCLLSERTKNLFEAWLQSVIAYSMYPIAAAATIGVLVTVLGNVGRENVSNSAELDSIMIFLVLMLLGKATMATIPIMASNLTGHISLSSFSPEKMSGAGLLGKGAAAAKGAAGNKVAQYARGAMSDGQTRQQKKIADQGGTKGDKAAAEAGRRLRQKLSGGKSGKPPGK